MHTHVPHTMTLHNHVTKKCFYLKCVRGARLHENTAQECHITQQGFGSPLPNFSSAFFFFFSMICCNFVSSTVRLGLIFLSLTFFWWFVDAFQLYFCCKRWGSKRNLNAAPFGVMRKKGVPVPFDVNGSKGGQRVKG